MKKSYCIAFSGFNPFKNFINIIRQKERSISNICKFTNKKEQEIIEFLQNQPISYEDLEIFCSIFGKLPNKNQVSIIYKSKSDTFYANFLAAHYLHNKEF